MAAGGGAPSTGGAGLTSTGDILSAGDPVPLAVQTMIGMTASRLNRRDVSRVIAVGLNSGTGESCLWPWTGSWTGVPDNPRTASAVTAMTRAIYAANAHRCRWPGFL